MKIMTHQKFRSATPVASSQSVSPFWRLRSLLFAALAIVAGGSVANAQLANGDFELGNLSNWSQTQAGATNWYNYTGTSAPVTGGFFDPVSAPPQGDRAAISDSAGAGWAILYRDIPLPAGPAQTLKLQVYYVNRAVGGWITPADLTNTAVPNQQFRVDIIDPLAPLNTTTGVLLEVFKTEVGDDLSMPPTQFCADLSAYAGSTVRLRIAVAMTENTLNASVDDVQLDSDPSSGGGERERIQQVQSQAIAILGTVTDKGDRKKLADAIKRLGQADGSKLWDEANRPTLEDGKKIFDRVRDAVKKLADLRAGAKTLSLRPQMTPLIDELVATTRMIATRSIDELTLVGPGSNKPADAQKKLNEAIAERAKGDVDASESDPDSAVSHYKHAWQKAADKVDDIANEN
ncbi:MAG: hypothetical protein ABMA01_03495 [Chthoniobacteraceae bacterium]